MKGSTTGYPFILLLLIGMAAAGCQPSDPETKILEERARWEVRVLSWAQDDTGAINVSTRVSGPPASRLAHLTVRVNLLDADGAKLGEHWHSFDLADVPRGGPSDLRIRISDVGGPVEGLSAEMLLQPTPDERARIKELAD